MKEIYKLCCITTIWLVITSGVFGQRSLNIKRKVPRWISDKGFWQIESNLYTPQNSIVYFYNNENILVYKEYLGGVELDLNERKVKMRLKRALHIAIKSWNKDHVLRNNQQWVAMLFRK